ncbi:MAG: L-serine ammonia-lyase, iron-sulfur-dependent, subunit alpha [Fretibacterium sp.]|nr:L-serine ammonia-lyase, iron-sulfur-dependent, subunit alpha [Fretibacterium sp.]
MLKYESIKALTGAAASAGKKISEVVLADQARGMECDELALFARMEESFDVMREAARRGQEEGLRSMSGLTGGEGHKMKLYAETGGLSGPFLTKAMSVALAVAGCNAAMGKIVATPTAGSCGILPGCLVPLLDEGRAEKRNIVLSLFTAGAFGMVIAKNACIAGAQGGCQAECGSASGMAAAALVELAGGTPAQCGDACAIAIANQLGLVCDPVAGLVEIPCIKRNASGVMIAFSSADMALAGIEAKIPVDECIAAMRSVGDALPPALKETAGGGLAATPTGRALRRKVFGQPPLETGS